METYKIGQWFLREHKDKPTELYVLSLVSTEGCMSGWNLICVNDGYRWDDTLHVSEDSGSHFELDKDVFEDWVGEYQKESFVPIDKP